MDRVIFGDNQFFGINHMSEEKAQAQAMRFKDVQAIMDVIDVAHECGLRGFMFSTHDRVAEVCDRFRENPEIFLVNLGNLEGIAGVSLPRRSGQNIGNQVHLPVLGRAEEIREGSGRVNKTAVRIG